MNEVLGSFGRKFHIVAPREALQRVVKDGVSVDGLIGADGFFRTSAAVHRTDGFFAAAIEFEGN